MLSIYQTTEKDWLGYPIHKDTPLTRHHIFKYVYGGASDISNYALLIQVSHQYLHSLERTDREAYNQIAELFQELNESMAPPTEEYYQKVGKVLKKSRQK